MSNILTGRTTKTIREQIIAILNKNGEMRFSEIKAAMGGKNDNTINRELKSLIAEEPPIVIKNESGRYLLNHGHPQHEHILGLIGLIPNGTDIFEARSKQSKKNENIGYSLAVVSSHLDGFKEDLREGLNLDETVAEAIDKLYFGVLLVKLSRIVQNKIKNGEIKEDEAKDYFEKTKKEVFEEGIELHFLPIKKTLKKP